MLTAAPDGPNNTFALDVDNDGLTDFTFETIIGDTTDPTFASFANIDVPFGVANGEVVDALSGGFDNVSRLSAGTTVGSSSLFSFINDQGSLYSVDVFDPPSGNFQNASGFVGLRFLSGTNTLYGYAYVTVNDLLDPTDPLGVTIGQVAYQTDGSAITLPAVPEPANALFVLSSLGGAVASRRRKK